MTKRGIFIGIFLMCMSIFVPAHAITCQDGYFASSDESSCIESKFSVTLVNISATTTFSFSISATGTFYINWGDGSATETISRSNTTATTYSHQFDTSGTQPYKIQIGGVATGYSSDASTAAISFAGNTLVAGISGSLGTLFPTVGSDQPRFISSFENCTQLSGNIPPKLFDGLSGTAVTQMFEKTFSGCSNLGGGIQNGFFGTLSGTAKKRMFYKTFSGCQSLTGYIPDNLFYELTESTNSKDQVMNNIFQNSGFLESCPTGTEDVTSSGLYNTKWSNKVACRQTGSTCDATYNDVCLTYCTAGFTKLKTNTGLEMPIFSQNVTSHSIVLKHDGILCYVPLETGAKNNTINVSISNITYHAITTSDLG